MDNYGTMFRAKIYNILSEMHINVGSKSARVVYVKPERANQNALPLVIVGDCSITGIQSHTCVTVLETFELPIAIHAQGSRSSSTEMAGSFQAVYDCKYEIIKSLYNFSWSFEGTLGGNVSVSIQDDEVEGSEILTTFVLTITVETPSGDSVAP